MINFSRFIKESSYVLLQSLAKRFGNYEIYCEQCNYVPNLDDLDWMYKLFNQYCFQDKLFKIPFLCMSPSQLKQKFNKVNVSGSIDEIADDYGAYIARIQFYIENATGEYVCDILDESIYLNMSLGRATVLGIATIVCHEMAHQYDAWFGDYTQLILDEQRDNKTYDAHTTNTFEKLAEQISKKGLYIMQKTKDATYQQMNIGAVKKAKLLCEVEFDSSKYTKVSDCVYFARFSSDSSMQASTIGKVQVN